MKTEIDDVRFLLSAGARRDKLEKLYGPKCVKDVADDSEGMRVLQRITKVRITKARAASMLYLSTVDNDKILADLLNLVVADEMMLDPLTLCVMGDPVVMSSGFVVDRYTIHDDSGDLEVHSCPFSHEALKSCVYPLKPLQEKISKFELRRLKHCISCMKKMADAEEWGRAKKISDVAEAILTNIGEDANRDTAKELAEIEKCIPETTVSFCARTYSRLLHGATAEKKFFLSQEIGERFTNESNSACKPHDYVSAFDWARNGFVLIIGNKLVEERCELSIKFCKIMLKCSKESGKSSTKLWEARSLLNYLLEGEEQMKFLASEGITGEELELISPECVVTEVLGKKPIGQKKEELRVKNPRRQSDLKRRALMHQFKNL